MGKGFSHCWLLFKNKFLALNVPFPFGLGQQVINTIEKKLMEKYGLGQNVLLYFVEMPTLGKLLSQKQPSLSL